MPSINDLIAEAIMFPGSINDKLKAFFDGMSVGSGPPTAGSAPPAGGFYFDYTNGNYYRAAAGSANYSLTSGVSASAVMSVVGWHPGSGIPSVSAANIAPVLNQLLVNVPILAQEPITIDQVGCYLYGAGTGNIRFGIYQVNNPALPFDNPLGANYASLLLDSGRGISSAATGIISGNVGPITIPIGTWFTTAIVFQGTAAPSGYYAGTYSNCGAVPWGALAIGSGPRACVRLAGVGGALPPTVGMTSFGSNYDNGIFLHRSA